MAKSNSDFHLRVASPDKLLFDSPVSFVIVPASEGEVGILPHHTPFLSLLKPGKIKIQQGKQERKEIGVTSGYVEVSNNCVTVLAQTSS